MKLNAKHFVGIAGIGAMLSFGGCSTDLGDTSSDDGNSGGGKIKVDRITFFGTEHRDFGYAGAVDKSGNLFVVGYTNGNVGGVNAGKNDAFLVKLDGDGNILCKAQVGGNGDERGEGVAVDSAGNVYMALSIENSSAVESINTPTYSHSAAVVKFDNQCNTVEIRMLNDDGINAEAYDVAVDSNDNVYVVGKSKGLLQQGHLELPQGGYDYFLTRLDTDLNIYWFEQYGSKGNDVARSIALDEKHGALFISGQIDKSITGIVNVHGYSDGMVARYDMKTGARQWIKAIGTGGDSGGSDYAYSVAATSSGDVVVGFRDAGRADGYVYYLNGTDGTTVWNRKVTGYSLPVVGVGAKDAIYVSQNDYTSTDFIKKLNPENGEVVWDESFGPQGHLNYVSVHDIVFDSKTDWLYMIGATENNFRDPYAQKKGTSGAYDAFVFKFR